ncbi:MAG: MFS transporter [Deltaproteobacteria bacterium]|nr:MFS transporter [Deltaproteobacteria bacterium]
MSERKEDIKYSSAREIFRALRHRNYRLFFSGQIVSLCGTWITSVASSWLIYRLTQSEWLLGLVAFVGQFPAFLLAPMAGVLVDRWNRQKVLLATQSVSLLQSLALAALTLSGAINVPWICFLTLVQALVNAFDMPARQAFVNEIVEDKLDLPNAIALNSAMFNAARLVGPSIGGVIIALSNEGICFLVDAISYIPVLICLSKIQIPPARLKYSKHHIIDGLKEGSSYAFGFAPIRYILILVASISLLGTPHLILMPVFAREILGGGPGLLGALMAASGCGALVGALSLAARRSVLGLGNVIKRCAFALGLSLIAFSFSTLTWLSMLLMFFAGAAMITLLASSNTIIQTLVEDNKRGRVMSFYMMAVMGTMPIGSLLAGTLASHIGAPSTVLLGGSAGLIIATMFSRKLPKLRDASRPIYIEKGILPKPASE